MEHLTDLSDRSEQKGIYTFSDFLSADEQSKLLERKKQFTAFCLFGGADGTERNMVRFGSEDAVGYTQDFPIVCLKAEPLNVKFAQTLTHRDYLGSIMALGLERSALGDIVVREHEAYIFCEEKLADYIMENLTRVKGTDIRINFCSDLPEGSLYQTQPLRFTVSSLRFDCLASAALRLSRGHTQDLFREKKVFLNGAVCEKPDTLLTPGDVFSVRGYGKFRFREISGQSKKGKIVAQIEKYV